MDDILLIDKPAGITSHDVVDEVRKIFKTRRVGHAGTLDPFATGLLIVGVNAGTKKLTALVGLDKTYEATLRLGATSDTFDPEGVITESVGARPASPSDSTDRPDRPIERGEAGLAPTRKEVERVLDVFRGGYEQKAPLHSAKKIGGKKLYDLARAGTATEEMRPVKQVTISELVILDYAWPKLSLRVSSSSGTYIRSLADDIGRELGCGAFLTALRRTRIGTFDIKDALSLSFLRRQESSP